MNRVAQWQVILLAVLSALGGSCASAREDVGGYYESLKRPDLGQASASDSGYKQGEGYYGKLVVPLSAPEAPPEDAQKSKNGAEGESGKVPPQAVAPAAIEDLTPVTEIAPRQKPTAQDAMDEGKRMFSQSAYHAAEEAFQAACVRDPKNQLAHYMLGLTRDHLRDPDGAKEQMQIAFALSPFSEIGQKARASILDLSQLLNRQDRTPVDSPQQLQQTMRDMRRQAMQLEAQKGLDGARSAQWARYSGQLEAYKIRSSYGDFGPRRRHMRRIAVGDQFDISNMGIIKSNYALSDSYVRSSNARRDAVDRQRSIQDYMNSGLSLLGDPIHEGQPHLRAFGTNLYIRYYGSDTADSPPETIPDDPAVKATAGQYQKVFGVSHKADY